MKALLTFAMIFAALHAWCGERVGVSKDDLDGLKQKSAKPKEANPLDAVADQMLSAQVKLKQGQTDEETQKPQARAIEMLDQLIEMARQQQQQQQDEQKKQKEQKEREQDQQNDQAKPDNSNASQQQDSTNPAQKSQENPGKAGPAAGGANEPPGQKGIEWGNLPPKTREEFNQIMKEDFPEVYKNLLELYFKNLSDR